MLYEEARLARLGTEKFMLDGRHTGTGGGNHVTLGGPSPADSPMLRNPQVLGSLVRYWQNHPALSYLFSGMFVGPTSQAPRVDEARDDSLYELEIALQQMPKGEVPVALAGRPRAAQPAGRYDRQYSSLGVLHRQTVFTGLGHRASRSGRVSRFRNATAPADVDGTEPVAAHPWWRVSGNSRTKQAPVRWGTELHDRFMLPHYVAA